MNNHGSDAGEITLGSQGSKISACLNTVWKYCVVIVFKKSLNDMCNENLIECAMPVTARRAMRNLCEGISNFKWERFSAHCSKETVTIHSYG